MHEFIQVITKIIDLIGPSTVRSLLRDQFSKLTAEDVRQNIATDTNFNELVIFFNASNVRAEDVCLSIIKDYIAPEIDELLIKIGHNRKAEMYIHIHNKCSEYYEFNDRNALVIMSTARALEIYFESIISTLENLTIDEYVDNLKKSVIADLNLMFNAINYDKLNNPKKESISFQGEAVDDGPFRSQEYEQVYFLKTKSLAGINNLYFLKCDHFFIRQRSIFNIILALVNSHSEFNSLPVDTKLQVFAYLPNNLFPFINNKELAHALESLTVTNALENATESITKEDLYLRKLKCILFANIIPILRSNSNLMDIASMVSMLEKKYLINQDLFLNNFSKAFNKFIAKHKQRHDTYYVALPERQKMYERAASMKSSPLTFKFNTLGTDHFSHVLGVNDEFIKPKTGIIPKVRCKRFRD